MSETCGCCEEAGTSTPLVTGNRPGLDALAYRAGTHAAFLETMKARLSGHPALAGLTTRAASDPSIALLDAWATVADVLTFYSERIANEGYLRTATERRSVLDLARLVGYVPRPGVAASVYLAFTLDDVPGDGYNVDIPAGTRAMSLPGPGELPQPFETADDLEARAAWNDLRPRLTRPQPILPDDPYFDTLHFEGITTNLRPNDPLLFVFGEDENEQRLRRIAEVEAQPLRDRTRVTLQADDAVAPDDVIRHARKALEGDTLAPDAAIRNYQEVLEEHLDLEEFHIGSTQIAQDIAERLEETRSEVVAGISAHSLLDVLERRIADLQVRREGFQRRYVNLQKWSGSLLSELVEVVKETIASETAVRAGETPASVPDVEDLFDPLRKRPSVPPAGPSSLERDLARTFERGSDAVVRLLASGDPALQATLYPAWANAAVTEPPELESVQALRVRAAPFGHNALLSPIFDSQGAVVGSEEWTLARDLDPRILTLDARYDQVLRGSWVAIRRPAETETERRVILARVKNVETLSVTDYGIPATAVTQLTLDREWLSSDDAFAVLRATTVFAQGEPLELADQPIEDDVSGDTIELSGLYDGLKAGRWLIVSGERADVPGTSGVAASELVMLAGVAQGVQQVKGAVEDPRRGDRDPPSAGLPGDRTHTFLRLARPLAYRYRRETVEIHGNVARATHGETRAEVLGSGDGGKALQRFGLKQSPLTYVSAATPAGTESTLEVYVDEVRRHEAGSPAGLGPADRRFVTQADDSGRVTVVFGDGVRGARLPTGVENVHAEYRVGIGKAGNVAAGQIDQLATRPIGLSGVINPMPATGGADRESRDHARRNAPLAAIALDRLVSVRDYEDFARTFAGVGKASAGRLTDGRRQVVHVTIAGADDAPVAEDSDLHRNLGQALRRFGDPYQPSQVQARELLLLILSVRVGVLPDHRWEKVEPKVRAALLETFGFDNRQLGQDALLSEAIGAVQRVSGVAYVDVDTFGAIPETLGLAAVSTEISELAGSPPQPRVPAKPARSVGGVIKPAQLALLAPRVPETLILEEITA